MFVHNHKNDNNKYLSRAETISGETRPERNPRLVLFGVCNSIHSLIESSHNRQSYQSYSSVKSVEAIHYRYYYTNHTNSTPIHRLSFACNALTIALKVEYVT